MGVARIVREYADAGIEFDERRILDVIDHLQAIVEEQRTADAEPFDTEPTPSAETSPDPGEIKNPS